MNTGSEAGMTTEREIEFQLLDQLFDDLWPICRSITGPGLEASLAAFSEHMPLRIEKVASGTKVFDWEVPPEWHFRRARLWGPNGEIVCDSKDSNLHVLNYSEPVSCELDLEELQPHLHSLESLPDAIPYVTSYYNRRWGICLTHRQRLALVPGRYRVEIESHFSADGGVPFAHCVVDGESSMEVLLTSYLCHPSLANNELSGPLVLLALYRRISEWPRRRFSYRFLLNPETIGALCFLHVHGAALHERLRAGLVLTCVGGPNTSLRYKASRPGDSVFDDVVETLKPSEWTHESFSPLSGSDERQYCSPGFNLPIGQVARTAYGEYDGYHNSLDTKAFMDTAQLQATVDQVEALLKLGEVGGAPVNLQPYGEPQLGKRDLYPSMNSPNTWRFSTDSDMDGRTMLNSMLTILNMADGTTRTSAIAQQCELTIEQLLPLLELLEQKELLSFTEET